MDEDEFDYEAYVSYMEYQREAMIEDAILDNSYSIPEGTFVFDKRGRVIPKEIIALGGE